MVTRNINIIITLIIFFTLLYFLYSTKEHFSSSCPNLVNIYCPSIEFIEKIGNKPYKLKSFITEKLAHNFVRTLNDIFGNSKKVTLGEIDRTNVHSNMQMHYQYFTKDQKCDLNQCKNDSEDINNCECEQISTHELKQFMKKDLEELQQILKNNTFNDTTNNNYSKKRVGTIISTMIDTSKDSKGIHIIFIPCFFGFNKHNEKNRSIIELTLDNKTYYIIELFKQIDKDEFNKTIESIDYSELPLNWYHTFINNKKKIKALEDRLKGKTKEYNDKQKVFEDEIEKYKKIINKIQGNNEFIKKTNIEKEIEKDYDNLKQIIEKDLYKDPRTMRFKKFKGKKIPAFLYPELFIIDFHKKEAADKQKLKEKRSKELERSSIYVTYKNIVERQVEQLRKENEIKVEAEMKKITEKEKELKIDFNIDYDSKTNTQSFIEFKNIIKENKKKIDNISNQIIKTDNISCSEKAKLKNMITILKKSTLKLNRFIKKSGLAINLVDIINKKENGQSKIDMTDQQNFVQSESNEYTKQNMYFKIKPHKDIPFTTQSTTTNYLSRIQQGENTYMNSFKDSYM